MSEALLLHRGESFEPPEIQVTETRIRKSLQSTKQLSEKGDNRDLNVTLFSRATRKGFSRDSQSSIPLSELPGVESVFDSDEVFEMPPIFLCEQLVGFCLLPWFICCHGFIFYFLRAIKNKTKKQYAKSVLTQSSLSRYNYKSKYDQNLRKIVDLSTWDS